MTQNSAKVPRLESRFAVPRRTPVEQPGLRRELSGFATTNVISRIVRVKIIREAKHLDRDERAILLDINEFMGEKVYCWPSGLTLAASTKIPLRTVWRVIRRLRDRGILVRENRRSQTGRRKSSNTYTINWPILAEHQGKKIPTQTLSSQPTFFDLTVAAPPAVVTKNTPPPARRREVKFSGQLPLPFSICPLRATVAQREDGLCVTVALRPCHGDTDQRATEAREFVQENKNTEAAATTAEAATDLAREIREACPQFWPAAALQLSRLHPASCRARLTELGRVQGTRDITPDLFRWCIENDQPLYAAGRQPTHETDDTIAEKLRRFGREIPDIAERKMRLSLRERFRSAGYDGLGPDEQAAARDAWRRVEPR